MGRLLAAALLLALARPARALETAVSSAPAKVTVNDLYGGTKLRDPFQMPTAGGGAGPAAPKSAPATDGAEEEGANEAPEFSIHALDLKGVLRDPAGAYAVLVSPQTGAGYILRGGTLYDYKNKKVPGVRGTIQVKQKTVILTTPDKDVQTLRLGETEEDAERGEKKGP